MSSATLAAAIDRALAAYAELTELAEDIEDEWSYVNDLSSAWRDRLEAALAPDPDAAIDPAADAAIDRAIDWLSTFPQVALLALGQTP